MEQNPTLPPWTAPPTPIRPRPPEPVKQPVSQPKRKQHTMVYFNIFAVLLVASILTTIAVNETIDVAEVLWALLAGTCFVLLGVLAHHHRSK